MSTAPRCSTRSTTRRLLRRRGTHRKGRPAGRYLMVVHQRDDGIAHIAVLEGRTLVEHYVSMPTDDTLSIDGNIYLGRVQNVLPGMEAAFIDIGTPKNGVLYRGDVVYDPADVEGKQRPRIESVLRNGQSIIVQVTKNPIAHKGARLTQEVSLAGRFVVMVPNQPQTYGISKRLPEDERKRLRQVLDRLASEGRRAHRAHGRRRRDRGRARTRHVAPQRAVASDLRVREEGEAGQPALQGTAARDPVDPRGVHQGVPRCRHRRARALQRGARRTSTRSRPSSPIGSSTTTRPRRTCPIFEKFHVHEQLHKALERKVWLPSGGSLVIERTEALTVIDVNTGKNVGTSNLEETVYRNNLEAAEAIARELRLRDIGGIIVTDFIDMEIAGESRSGRRSVPGGARP